MNSKHTIWLLGTAAAALCGTSAAAQSTGTPAGTQVDNVARIDYSSGGVAQAPVNSNTSSFLVDEKINLTVAELGGVATVAGAGGTGYVTEFTVTNLSNARQDFALSAAQDATGATTAFGQVDGFNVANLRFFVDNGDNVFNPAQDTLTFVDELAPGASVRVFVLGDIPAGTADGLYAGITLTAQAAQDGTAGTLGPVQVQSTGPDTANVDIVFADGAGDTDAANDGRFSDDDEYRINAPNFALVKSSRVISDPVAGVSANAHRIPGAVVEYCIAATNNGSGAATGATVTDNLSNVTGVTYLAGSLFVGATVSGGTCSGGTLVTDDNDADNGSVVSEVVSGTLGTIAVGATSAVRFRVTVD